MHFLIAAKTQTARPSASLLEEQLAGLAGECCIVLAGGGGWGAARRLGTSQIDSWCSRTHLHWISGRVLPRNNPGHNNPASYTG